MITASPELNPEAQVRLLIALSQISLAKGDFWLRSAGGSGFALVESKEIGWWRPAACYFSGKAKLELGNATQALDMLHLGLRRCQ
ncbi:MAG: hypothetical protein IPK53_19420 [bacterium]|nr:hypothetical protein [bacterium]